MTTYLNEYRPNARFQDNRVGSDPRKLKFNNIQSCLAVVLLPDDKLRLVGVHLTVFTPADPRELAQVLGELQAAVGPQPCDGYLVGPFDAHYARTTLAQSLRPLCRSLSVCDVPTVSAANRSADLDVKVELVNRRAAAWLRTHAVGLRDASGAFRAKPGYDPRTAAPGKPQFQTDRDARPWMLASFRPI